jgi:hypothetical protein
LALTRHLPAALLLWAASAMGAVAQAPSDETLPPALPDLPEAFAPEWLSDTVTRPHANVATSGVRPQFQILPIDAVELDAVGVLPRSITGLPETLWGASDRDARRLFRAQPVSGLPAALSFSRCWRWRNWPRPGCRRAPGRLFLARLDMLLDRGALDPAMALMERAGPTDPQVFPPLLRREPPDGHADRACRRWRPTPTSRRPFRRASSASRAAATGQRRRSPSARARRWGGFTEVEADLIARFLDPELFEGEAAAPDPALTPLAFQMRMAIAERPDTTGLPLAFVHADLSPLAGWRAQLEAAERLMRSGAIEPQQWFAIYTARVPSASGAVWDRVASVQALDAALLAGDTRRWPNACPSAFEHMQDAGLRSPSPRSWPTACSASR